MGLASRLSPNPGSKLQLAIGRGALVYLGALALWLAVQQLIGDRSWWLFALNAMSIYLFLPLPLALAFAAWRRSLPLLGGSLAAVAVFVLVWGGLFWPNSHERNDGPVLTVMAYNLLGFNPDPEGVVEALRESDADVVGLSELNPGVAKAIRRELRDEYPYQTLDPQDGVRGSGIISRFAFERVEAPLDDPDWVSDPIAIELQFDGRDVIFIAVHGAYGVQNYEARDREARLISEFVSGQSEPVIVAGDFNTTDRNDSYATLTQHMYDAWEKAGSGLGNTFPGASQATSPGSSRPDILGIAVPKWLVRIDYVFCSYDWEAIGARIGPWDSNSDHRPVIAEVTLRDHPYAGP